MKPRNEAMLISNAKLLLHLPQGISRRPETDRLLFSEVDIGDAKHAAAAEAGGEAEEDLAVVGDAVEALGKEGDRMDAVLVTEEGPGEAGSRVADGPRGVALETDHLVGALHHCLPDAFQHFFLVGNLVLL